MTRLPRDSGDMPSTQLPAQQHSSLPSGIEIFRSGRHTDDAGNVHEFTDADLAAIAAGYNPAVREAPLTIGHPADNLPAWGWVKGLARAADGTLTMATHNVEPQFAEMVSSKRFPKRSASFYPPGSPNNPTPGQWYLRHVAFLGAQPPAIAGLKDIQFSEADAAGAVSFSEPIPATSSPQEPDEIMTKEEIEALQAKLKAEQEARASAEADAAKAKAETASFAEKAKADRKAGFVSFAEAQVQAGRLLPKDKDMAVATLQALADVQPVSFAEGNTTTEVAPAQWLQSLISGAAPVVSFGEFAGGQPPAAAGSAKGKSDAEIDREAQAYAKDKGVSYAEALTHVCSFTS